MKPRGLALLRRVRRAGRVRIAIVDSEDAAARRGGATRLSRLRSRPRMPGILHKTERSRRASGPRRRGRGARRVARSRPASRPARDRRANDAEGRGNRARHGPRSAVRPARHRRRRRRADRAPVRPSRRAGARSAGRPLAASSMRLALAPAARRLSRRARRSTSTISRSRSAAFRCSPPTSPISCREIDVNPLVCGREIAAVDALS